MPVSEKVGIIYPGSASNVSLPNVKPAGSPKSSSIRLKNVEVVTPEPLPLPPEEDPPPGLNGGVTPVDVPSAVVVLVRFPNNKLK